MPTTACLIILHMIVEIYTAVHSYQAAFAMLKDLYLYCQYPSLITLDDREMSPLGVVIPRPVGTNRAFICRKLKVVYLPLPHVLLQSSLFISDLYMAYVILVLLVSTHCYYCTDQIEKNYVYAACLPTDAGQN